MYSWVKLAKFSSKLGLQEKTFSLQKILKKFYHKGTGNTIFQDKVTCFTEMVMKDY